MKNNLRKIFEIISHIVTVVVVFLFISHKNKTEKLLMVSQNTLSIQNALEVEERYENYFFPSVSVLDENLKTVSLNELLDPRKINVVLVTALAGCDECRDRELSRWGRYYLENESSNVFVIIVNQNIDRNLKPREEVSMVKALSSLPVFFDKDSAIVDDLGILSSETPLIFFLSGAGEVFDLYKGSSFAQKRSEKYLKMIKGFDAISKDCLK